MSTAPSMPIFYADSSALVKRHVAEIGSGWFGTLADPTSGNLIITARLSVPEVISAFNRRRRENNLDAAQYTQLAADFNYIVAVEYQIIELSTRITAEAQRLLERYAVRASDAVQLASALVVEQTLQRQGVALTALLAADDRLLMAAQAAGLPTDDPRRHP